MQLSTIIREQRQKYKSLYLATNLIIFTAFFLFFLLMETTNNMSNELASVITALSNFPFSDNFSLLISIAVSLAVAIYSFMAIVLIPVGIFMLVVTWNLLQKFALWPEPSMRILKDFFTEPARFFYFSDAFYYYLEYMNLLFMAMILFRLFYFLLKKDKNIASADLFLSIFLASLIVTLNATKAYLTITYHPEFKLYFFTTTFIFLITISFENMLSALTHVRRIEHNNLLVVSISLACMIAALGMLMFQNPAVLGQTGNLEYVLWTIALLALVATLSSYDDIRHQDRLLSKLLFPVVILSIGTVTYSYVELLGFSLGSRLFIVANMVFLITYSIKYFTSKEMAIIALFSLVLFFQDRHILFFIDYINGYYDSVIAAINSENLTFAKAWSEARQNLLLGLLNPEISGLKKFGIVVVMAIVVAGSLAIPFIGIGIAVLGVLHEIAILFESFGPLFLIFLLDILITMLYAGLVILALFLFDRLLHTTGYRLNQKIRQNSDATIG